MCSRRTLIFNNITQQHLRHHLLLPNTLSQSSLSSVSITLRTNNNLFIFWCVENDDCTVSFFCEIDSVFLLSSFDVEHLFFLLLLLSFSFVCAIVYVHILYCQSKLSHRLTDGFEWEYTPNWMDVFIEGKATRSDAANQYFGEWWNSFLKTNISIKDPNQQKLINVLLFPSRTSPGNPIRQTIVH